MRVNPGIWAPEGIEPVAIEDDFFVSFCNWADSEGIGEEIGDWKPWFDCFMMGWLYGYELGKERKNA